MTDYASESPASVQARRKRRRSLITLAVVVLGLFFAFWYALSYYRADAEVNAGSTPAARCTPFDPAVATPETTTVNIYNATTRNGLAGSTAKGMESRGFVIGKVANDPSKRKTPAVAEVRFGPKGETRAKLVQGNLQKGATLVKDKRKDASVDLAVGTKFSALVPVPSPSGPPMCPAPSVSPSASASP
ncbi:MAG: LytR C-terminal domain-containing protein [Ornithinibacter sp.]